MLTLYHLRISHFSEKARWALNYKGLQYRSRLLTPGYHILTTRRVAGTRTVPVLVDTEGDSVVSDSTDILHYLDRIRPDPPLFPRDADLATAVAEAEDAIDTDWGPNSSGYTYCCLLQTPDVLRARWSGGLNVFQRAALFLAMPLFTRAMARSRNLGPATASKYLDAARSALDDIETRLANNGGQYLVGNEFTAADLTAAAMMGPYIAAPGSPWDGSADDLPADLLAFRREVSTRPAGEYGLRIWAQHRNRPAPVASR